MRLLSRFKHGNEIRVFTELHWLGGLDSPERKKAMAFAFKFEMGRVVTFVGGPNDLSGTVIGLFVDRRRIARVLVEWWKKDGGRHSEYFDEDELS